MVEQELDIFLLMEQSNMAGRGDISEAEAIEHPDVFMFRGGQWIVAREPLHDDTPSAVAGLRLATRYRERMILILKSGHVWVLI